MMKLAGVYIIHNNVNNKVYIGASRNVYNRLCDHKVMLRKGIHHNEHLQASYDKYKEENFTFDILEECHEDFIFSQENYWCNMLNSHSPKYGYNNQPTSPNGKQKCSEQTKLKMSKSKSKRQVFVYDIYGRFCEPFSDLYSCAKKFDTVAPNVHRKMNQFPKKLLIDSKSSRYIFMDNNVSVEHLKSCYDKIFTSLNSCNGNYTIYDCFDNLIGTASSKDISRILNVKVSAVSNAERRKTYLKGLKIVK
jgi:group I intron endonuclease